MKKLIFSIWCLGCIQLFALNIVLNSTREKSSNYAILHIYNNKPFKCNKIYKNIEKPLYKCVVDGSSSIKINPKKTKFVDISFFTKDNKTIINIKPNYNIKAFQTSFPLYETKEIKKYKYNKAKHWIFLLYKKNIFLKSQNKEVGIDFPVYFTNNLTPSIGALDLNGIPIGYVGNSKDIAAYLSIRNDYNAKQYTFVVSEANKAIKNFPNSIFLDDFLLYKIRAMNKTLASQDNNIASSDIDYSHIIKLGKQWIKEFPSNQNIPEVLYYIAKAYQGIGQNSDAKYFYDILITEHPNSKYTKLGILTFADNLYAQNQKQKAIRLYKNVLFSTKDINIASMASDRLAKLYLNQGDISKAKEYYAKIINANPEFYFKDSQKAYDLAMKLDRNKMSDLSVILLEKMLQNLNKNDDLRESVLKSLGDIFKKLKDKKMAFKYYKEYLKEFKYGQYVDAVNRSLDGLFFDTDETNSTKLLERYNKLLKKYDNGKIYQKASILKAKLLIKDKKYKKALKFLDNFQYMQNNKQLVISLKKRAAKAIVINNLKKENCLQVVEMIDKYKLTIDTKYDNDLAKCYIDTNNFQKALTLAKNVLQNNHLSAAEQVFWLKMEAKAFYNTKQYKKLLMLSRDVITLGKTYDVPDYQTILYYKFFAQYGLNKYDDALKTAEEISKIFKNRYKNIEVYQKLVKYAKNIDESTMVVKYAKEIIRLQKKYKSYLLSPDIELDAITALKKLHKFKEAKDIAIQVLSITQNRDKKARIFYELGDIYLKMGKTKIAKNIFKKCSKLKVKSGWKNLCKESLKLF